MTLESLIRESASRLEASGVWFGHGTDNALDEASWLVLHALGLPPEQAPDYSQLVETESVVTARALVTERIERRVPSAYLTGSAWFCGLAFKSDERALVPRSPLAELIETGFTPWLRDGPVARALDLCTGSGCIAIALAHRFTGCAVDATDLSADALSLAEENVGLHNMAERVVLYQGDLFQPVHSRRYDLIVSNPPYVNAADLAAMPAEYHAEPAMGLGSGDDGLDITRRILANARDHLEPDGLLVVEVGESMAAAQSSFDALALNWIDLACGGDGVFAIAASDLPR